MEDFILSTPKRGTSVRQSPDLNIIFIYRSWLVFSAHLPLPKLSLKFSTLLLLSTLHHLSSLLSLCWCSILLTADPSFSVPDREPISVAESLLCEGLWGGHDSLAHHCQTLIWAQVTVCVIYMKEQIWTKGNVALSQLGMKYTEVDIEVVMSHLFTLNILLLVINFDAYKSTDAGTRISHDKENWERSELSSALLKTTFSLFLSLPTYWKYKVAFIWLHFLPLAEEQCFQEVEDDPLCRTHYFHTLTVLLSPPYQRRRC